MAIKKSSSRFTGERSFYLHKKVVVIPVSICHPFYHLDPVIHSLKYAGIQTMHGTGDYAAHVTLKLFREVLQCPDATLL